ncbi:MAG: ATP-binding protein [Pirellulaceae bacterium]
MQLTRTNPIAEHSGKGTIDFAERQAEELADTLELQRISSLLIQDGDVAALYQNILDAAAAIMHSDFASLQLLHSDRGRGGELQLLAFHGFTPAAAEFWRWVRTDSECTCGAALRAGRRVIVPDVEKCEGMAGTADQATLLQTGIHAGQSTPLVSRGGQMLGMISTHWRQPHEPAERSLGLLDALARQAADLIERKRNEDQLRQSSERLEGILASISDRFQTVDREWRFTYLNAAARRSYAEHGLDSDALLGKGLFEVFPDSPVAAELRRAMDERVEVNYETYFERWQRWFEGFAAPTPDGGLAILSRDVTQRKQADVALRENEERFRAIADSIPQLAWMADSTGHVGWFNRCWLDYTGTTLDENQGVGWKSVHHPDYVDRVAEKFERHLREGKDWEDTFPLRGKDGQYRWFLSRMKAIRGEAGEIVRFFGTNTDVTEQRELETQISQQAMALADLNRRKDEFLAMLSHELRNPLAPILNAVQLLKLQQGGTEIQRTAHAMIERQVSQLARLVDDLLEVSRISTGRIHLQEERIDLRGIVERAIEATRPQCGRKSQSLAQSLPDQPVWVQGDSVRLEQVVVNLLNNACKYTDRGGHIWVGLELAGAAPTPTHPPTLPPHAEHQPPEFCTLRVRDTGIGIAPELLPRIFNLFTQADKSLDRSQGGLGIGLALVQSLVTMHRGRVEALSKPGEGSEFVVHLPAMSSPSQPSIEAGKSENRTLHSLRVLVVDDNVDAAAGMAMLLRASGHETRVAHEGAAAMQAALEFVPQVVLLDIGLPVVNGFQVARSLRREPALAHAVLIALTGYGQESDRQRSQEAGFDHHLVKPVDFAKVQQILSAGGQKE